MDYHSIFLKLKSKFPDYQIFENYSLAPHTTLKIGGPADIFFQPRDTDQFKSILNFVYQKNKKNGDEAINFSKRSERVTPANAGGQPEGSEHRKNSVANLPLTILGNGSNILISDSGIRGLVIKNVTPPNIELLDTFLPPLNPTLSKPTLAISTQRMENEPDKYLDFSKIDYNESAYPRVSVQISAGTPLAQAINHTIASGWTGLQWFAYIPGTIGGAIWYNIHGGKYHLSQYLHQITVFNLQDGHHQTFDSSTLDWGYDTSPFQKNPHLIILGATFQLFKGDATLARATADAWIAQKSKIQPMNSAGSIFQNPNLEESTKIWGDQKSTGWIIDHELELKNYRLGDAVVGPQHANIFTNQGHATATDFLALINHVQSEVKKRFDLTLRPEIKLLGEF